jgi:TolB-like protein
VSVRFRFPTVSLWMADNIVEDITTALFRFKTLFVIACKS